MTAVCRPPFRQARTSGPGTAAARPMWRRLAAGAAALSLLAGCDGPLDFDLRGNFGNAPSTSAAVQQATTARPAPDSRGIISYPGYQVAVAERGDTVQTVARRIGTDAAALARFNGLRPDDSLRRGEVLALPGRVAEPSPATGAVTTGPIQPPSQVDITTLAGSAIDRAQPGQPAQTAAPAAATGREPVRHRVAQGETAYAIARLYNVSVRALADWNGLGPDLSVREGQFLLIPVPDASAPARTAQAQTSAPGSGSPTPVPPSAAQPLPRDAPAAATAGAGTAGAGTGTAASSAATTTTAAAAPNLGGTGTTSSNAAMQMPVQGRIIREYAKGRNDGIAIQAPPGTAIRAAAAGTVAAITTDANQVPIIVIRHPDNVMTVYANSQDVSVKRGDSVTRGQTIAKMRGGDENFLHFEVRQGFDSVDPMRYLR